MKQIFVIQDAITNQFYAHGTGWVDSVEFCSIFDTHMKAMHVASDVIEIGQILQIQLLLTK